MKIKIVSALALTITMSLSTAFISNKGSSEILAASYSFTTKYVSKSASGSEEPVIEPVGE